MRLKLLQIDRLSSSPSGNPRWRLHFDGDVVMETKADAMIGYAVSGIWLQHTFEVTPDPRHPAFIDDIVEVEQEHPDDCQYYAAGEGSRHTYEPPS